MLNEKPDAVLFSSGPGNPNNAVEVIEIAKKLFGKVPIFGIGLGMQVLAIALGASVEKMTCGHHGENYPVIDTHSGKVLITSQAHDFAPWQNSMDKSLHITYKNVNDGTVEGFSNYELNTHGILFHPGVDPLEKEADIVIQDWLKLLEDKDAQG